MDVEQVHSNPQVCAASPKASSLNRLPISHEQSFRTRATAGDTEELVRQYLAAYNEQDLDAIKGLWTDSLVYNGERIGPEEFEALHKSYWGAFPDINAEITHVVSEGEQVAVRLMFEGTGEGEYLGHDVDGKNFRVSEIAIFHVSDGKLDEYWFQFDELGLWSQLGVLERPYPEE